MRLIVTGLAVDWVNYNLYWADQTKGQIMVSKYDGRLPKILLENLYGPRALVADPVNGYVSQACLVYSSSQVYSNYIDHILLHLLFS